MIAIALGTMLYWAYRSGVNRRTERESLSQAADTGYREMIRYTAAREGYFPKLEELNWGMEILREVHARGRVDTRYAAGTIGYFMAHGKSAILNADFVEEWANETANMVLIMEEEARTETD